MTYDDNHTIGRLDMISDMAEMLAGRLLTRMEPWDDAAHAQRLILMRVAILLNDMDLAIPDAVIEAIDAADMPSGGGAMLNGHASLRPDRAAG